MPPSELQFLESPPGGADLVLARVKSLFVTKRVLETSVWRDGTGERAAVGVAASVDYDPGRARRLSSELERRADDQLSRFTSRLTGSQLPHESEVDSAEHFARQAAWYVGVRAAHRRVHTIALRAARGPHDQQLDDALSVFERSDAERLALLGHDELTKHLWADSGSVVEMFEDGVVKSFGVFERAGKSLRRSLGSLRSSGPVLRSSRRQMFRRSAHVVIGAARQGMTQVAYQREGETLQTIDIDQLVGAASEMYRVCSTRRQAREAELVGHMLDACWVEAATQDWFDLAESTGMSFGDVKPPLGAAVESFDIAAEPGPLDGAAIARAVLPHTSVGRNPTRSLT